MKKMILFLSAMVVLVQVAGAQIQNPVHWAYGLKKLDDKTYEVHLKATIDEGWHIYAQKQPETAVAVPTKILFTLTEGLSLIKTPVESGKKEIYTVKEAGVTNYEYSNSVDFIQKVTLTSNLKEIKGTITYQTCTHQMCLQAKTISFTVPVP